MTIDTMAEIPLSTESFTDRGRPDLPPQPCNCISENGQEIKFGWGGRREGAGRKPKQPEQSVATLRWCVLAFFGHAEISATRELTRQGYETYLPLVAIRRRDPVIASQFHIVRVPLLPGYGFIRLHGAESREPIVATRGVREVLRRPDGRAAWVRDVEIERMQGEDEKRLQLPRERAPILEVRAAVRVESGPFTGRHGSVIECDGVKTRVEVEMFGRQTPVWLDRVDVERV